MMRFSVPFLLLGLVAAAWPSSARAGKVKDLVTPANKPPDLTELLPEGWSPSPELSSNYLPGLIVRDMTASGGGHQDWMPNCFAAAPRTGDYGESEVTSRLMAGASLPAVGKANVKIVKHVKFASPHHVSVGEAEMKPTPDCMESLKERSADVELLKQLYVVKEALQARITHQVCYKLDAKGAWVAEASAKVACKQQSQEPVTFAIRKRHLNDVPAFKKLFIQQAVVSAMRPNPPPGMIVRFESDPPGAQVVVNNEPMADCITPCSRELRAGVHSVSFVKEKYRQRQHRVEIKEKNQLVRFPLDPTFRQLTILSRPEGVPISIDGEPFGTTPILKREVSRETHKVQITGQCFINKHWIIGPKQTELEFEAKPQRVQLDLRAKKDANDVAAKIYVDGRFKEETAARLSVPRCIDELRVEYEGAVAHVDPKKILNAPPAGIQELVEIPTKGTLKPNDSYKPTPGSRLDDSNRWGARQTLFATGGTMVVASVVTTMLSYQKAASLNTAGSEWDQAQMINTIGWIGIGVGSGMVGLGFTVDPSDDGGGR